MKSVLISIQPRWCALIASGKKTVEVRKTRPKIETPFKGYIYCTNSKTIGDFILCKSKENAELFGLNAAKGINKGFAQVEDIQLKGKVIGEFVCDYIEDFKEFKYSVDALRRHIKLNACIGYDEIYKYLGSEKCGYGWHISDLVIYEQPKELSEFFVYCGENPKCEGCEAHYYSNTESGKEDYCCSTIEGHRPLTRPFQSWGYVEDGI